MALKSQQLSALFSFILKVLGVCRWVQTSTTGPVWFGVIIRGAPTLLTCTACVVSLLCFQICVCFQNATLCVWAVRRMPQHTMETWAWPQWVLFILLYFLFQSLGKCPVCVCVLLLGRVAKLSSRFLYADPVRAGGGFSGKSLHWHFPARIFFRFALAAKHGHA